MASTSTSTSTSAMPAEVSVLILGGMIHVGRPLLSHLLTLTAPRVSHIRVADKYLISRAGSTTFVDAGTHAALADPRVEYRQVNLNLASTLEAVYTLPGGGGSYDVVYDLTGEGLVGTSVPEQLLVERVAVLAQAIAGESARRGVRAHIRDTPAFMTVQAGAPPAREGDTPRPCTPRALWYYEAERAVAATPGLNAAVTRSAHIVGPLQYDGAASVRIALGRVYQFLAEPMTCLWSPDLRTHIIHSHDWVRAAAAIATWLLTRDPAHALADAAEHLPPPLAAASSANLVHDANLCPRSHTPRTVVFNLVDNSDMTQGKMLAYIGDYFSIETGFTNAAVNTWARLNLATVADQANEKHAQAAARIIADYPHMQASPLSVFKDKESLANRAFALDGSKVTRVTGWAPQHIFSLDSIRDIVQAWKDINLWPEA